VLVEAPVGIVTLNKPYHNIQFEMSTFTAGKDENDGVIMKIYGKSHQSIDKFIEKCRSEYDLLYQRIRLSKPYTQHIFIKHRDTVHLQSETLNVKKTMKNTILNKEIQDKICSNVKTFLDSESMYHQLGIPTKKVFFFMESREPVKLALHMP
jgi:hypothetical protein